MRKNVVCLVFLILLKLVVKLAIILNYYVILSMIPSSVYVCPVIIHSYCDLLIYVKFSLHFYFVSGSKELLLEQKVPASYLALEDVVGHVAAERRQKGNDPVLNAQEYKTVVSNEMMTKFQRAFRDGAELHQATLFLHENGIAIC